MTNPPKIVVFDLDETLGTFVELGMFCDALENYTKNKIERSHFFELMDLFEEFLRPDIMNIMSFLVKKRAAKKCKKLMIYTNNQGPRSWAENIAKYFDHKLNAVVFDDIVAAFKVDGNIVEAGRTSHDKSVGDLLRCTQIPKNAKICFLDDRYHPRMKHSNVFYINAKPYTHSFTFREMADRYYKSHGDKVVGESSEFANSIHKYMNKYGHDVIKKGENEISVDKVISKKILQHLKEFLKSGNKTRRGNSSNKGAGTRKIF